MHLTAESQREAQKTLRYSRRYLRPAFASSRLSVRTCTEHKIPSWVYSFSSKRSAPLLVLQNLQAKEVAMGYDKIWSIGEWWRVGSRQEKNRQVGKEKVGKIAAGGS